MNALRLTRRVNNFNWHAALRAEMGRQLTKPWWFGVGFFLGLAGGMRIVLWMT